MTVTGVKSKVVLFLVNHMLAGTKYFECKRRLLNLIGFSIQEGTKIVGPIECTAKLTVGRDCWIGKNFIVNGNGNVTIGDNCDIAPEVIFQTGGHEIGSGNRRAGKGVRYEILVGNGCWIGARSTILGGVTIGDSSMVAACACVCDKVEENTLVGGVPAKVIRKLEGEVSWR